ncbi:MAG: CRISPR-associated endonuclease Cas2 [Nitrosomonas sp.]|uniref:CRISPR-associated endonuclease Cas2 n=1 Tax=Nitrosomonas sp. TaxID=42353 RepID=UPI00272F7D68|nr:CRISPR-associated endonuclease Cas2 [Nitrosomonas sp.]MDP1550262.1 CRISPR-associated endonuclease Cas2 [Nitrosomonas sp.]MDP3281504.1 CRISPR-associated endonuclease Cas2 [Nitrosomonas sp.]
MSSLYLVIISYDIAHPRRLNRVAKVLETAGVRIQKSVFECGLTPDALLALRLRLRRLIDPAEDHILITPVCSRCRPHIHWQGKLPDVSAAPYWII